QPNIFCIVKNNTGLNIISRSLLMVSLILGGYVSGANAQVSRFGYGYFTNDHNDTLRYRILTPDYDTTRTYPLVIFLHGSGERGNDNEAQLKWGVGNFATDQNMVQHPAIVIAPQCPEQEQWANF